MKHVFLLVFLLTGVLAPAQQPAALEQALATAQSVDTLATWIKIARANQTNLATADAYVRIGDVLVERGHYGPARAVYQRAQDIERTLGADTLVSFSCIRLGILAAGNGDLESALSYYQQAQVVLKTPRSVRHEARALINQANAYADLDSLAQAIRCDSLAELLLRGQKWTDLQAANAYGIAQRSMEQVAASAGTDTAALRRAERYFGEARRLYGALAEPDLKSILLCYNGLAAVGYYQSNKTPYRNYLQEGIRLAEENKDTVNLLNLLYNWSELERQDYNVEKAFQVLSRFKALVEQSGLAKDPNFRSSFFRDVRSVPYEATVDPRIFNTYVDDQLTFLQVKLEDEKQKSALWAGVGTLAVLVLGGLFFFQWYRNRERLEKQQLLLKQEEMESLVADSEAKAKEQSLTAETNARQGIRRELHDGAAAIMAAARWSFEAKIEQLEAENNPLAADLRTNLELQNRAYQALRNAIHRTEQDPVSWVDELRLFCNPLPGVSLIEYNLEEVPNGQFGRKCLNMTRELIANALKYARASKIEVQLARLDDELLSITVSDNGEGFDVKTIPVLQQRTDASVDATLPVENLPEVGAHGLDNVHRYVFELGGDIEVTSQLGEGTNVVIELPLPKPTL